MTVRPLSIDHVQLAMPAGPEAEAAADRFYAGLLGFEIVPKPEPLASRGGRWFRAGPVSLHLGVEEGFRPARKAHPALGFAGFDELIAALTGAGVAWRADDELPGVRRIFADDPFGNRLELIDTGQT